jgi:hypothetical protein
MSDNAIFEKLAAIPNDAVGVFAYFTYKKQKIDFCQSFGGRDPTRQELDGFYAVASLNSSIESYRAHGRALAQAFLNAGLDALIDHTENATRQDTLYKYLEASTSELGGKLSAINNTLAAKRTFMGWGREVAGNLMVNLVSIFVLGALLLGYRFTGEIQQGAEKKIGIDATISPSNASKESSRAANTSLAPK